MADKITLKSSSYDGRYLQLVCEQTAKDSVTNTSTVKWTLSAVGGSVSYYSTGPTKVVINGTTVYSKGRVKYTSETFPAKKGSISGTLKITHTNDGTKSISVSLSTAIYTSTVTEKKETWTLDNIARYGTSVQSLKSKTETSITINWSSDSTVDYLWYSKNNGTSWTGVDVTDGKSGTYTISSGVTPNTEYKIKTRIRRKDSQLTTDSTALSVTTYKYPYCTNAPDFVLGEPVTLTFYNPLGREFDFSIIGNGEHIYNWTGNTGTSYKGVNGEPAVTYLYDSIPNQKSAKYSVETVYNDNFILVEGGTYSIDESKCYPTFTTGYTLKDTGSKTASITNGAFLIKGYSSLTVEIPVSAQMKPKNGANAKNYTASFNGINKTISYSDTVATSCDFGVVNTTGTKEINVRAYDTRGLSTLAKKSIVVYDYYAPKIYIDVKRVNNFGEVATLKVSGDYSPITVSGVAKNTITKCEYRYRQTGGTWSSWVTLTTTLSNGKFTCSDVNFDDLDNNVSFEFEARVTDKLNTITTADVLNAGQGVFFISSNKKKCYVNGDQIMTLNDIYPVGSVYCSSTNTNPSSKFGGTWELKNKGFISLGDGGTKYFTANSNITTYNCYVVRNGKTLRIRLEFTPAVDITDTGLELGTFSLTEMGIEGFNVNYLDILGGSDGGNCACTFRISSAGIVTVSDIVGLDTFPKGQACYVDFTTPLTLSRMLDNACNEFYWVRTK